MRNPALLAALVAAAAVVCPARLARATVTSTSSSVSYTGNGATTAYTVPFKFQLNSDLVVKVNSVTKTITTDYSVSGAGAATGTVTFVTAPGNALPVTITRVVAYTQIKSLRQTRTYDPATVETALDKLTMQTQQLNAGISVSQNLTDATSATVTASGASSSRTLGDMALDILNVKSCGAVINGSTDDTTHIQDCITAAPTGGIVFLPAGTYKLSGAGITISKSLTFWMAKGATLTTAGISAIVVTASNVKIQGGTITLLTDSNGAEIQNGITPLGTVSNLTVEDVTFTGQATVPDGTHAVQTGFGNLSGQTLTNIRLIRPTASNVNVGLSFNADLSGSINGFLVDGCHLTNIVGTASGSGYGVHHANGSGNPSHGRITHCEIDSAQRHSIYQAKGSGVTIDHNVIRLHRTGVSDGSQRAAIVIARSQDIVADGNEFYQPSDGAISVSSELSTGAGNVCRNITVSNTVIVNPKGAPPLLVGGGAPATEGYCENVSFSGGSIYNDTTVSGYSTDLIRINEGKRISFTGMAITWINGTSTNGVWGIRGTSEGAGTANYTDDLSFTGNIVYTTFSSGGGSFGFNWLSAAATSAIRLTLVGNRFNLQSNVHTFGAGQTDPNIVVNGMGQSSGLTLNLGSNGQITLAAGTGTATVPSGCKALCTDQSANASVKCDVSATTLTATGTGTDVINYTCIR